MVLHPKLPQFGKHDNTVVQYAFCTKLIRNWKKVTQHMHRIEQDQDILIPCN